MANKSSKSPSGEDRENPSRHRKRQEVEKKDIAHHTGPAKSGESRKNKQENLKNRGIQEDHPHNPVRSTGSTRKSEESLPTGEPDKSDRYLKNNQTGPGLG
jgi:hypothetical protein